MTARHTRPAAAAVFGIVALAIAAGCAPRAPSAGSAVMAPAAVDSIVLERSRCFGSCPAYRLRIDGAAQVVLEPHNFPGPAVHDAVAGDVPDSLYALLQRSGFWTLPEMVQGSPLCPARATDHPTITVSVFGPGSKRVVYYTGCYLDYNQSTAPRLRALRGFAARMDTLTGAFRHIRAGSRR